MNEISISRTPNLIAAEINGIRQQTIKMVLYNSIEIGRRLTEAKEIVNHGEWGNWLKEVEYSKSTANNLMKIFQEYGAEQISLLGDNAKLQAFGDLSYSKAVLLLGVPGEEREDFIKDNKVNEMTSRELKDTIDKLKNVEEERKNAINERDKAKKEYQELIQIKESLEKAFDEGAAERVRIEGEKDSLINEIKLLENSIQDFKNSNTEITVDTADIEDEYQRRIEALKRDKQELEQKIKAIEINSNENIAIYEVHFKNVMNDFKKILESLESIKKENEVQYMKYREITRKFINTMLDRL